MLNRRHFAALLAAAGLAACAPPPPPAAPAPKPVYPPLPAFYGPLQDGDFLIPALAEGAFAPEYWRREVANPWPNHPPGTIVIDPDAAILHFVKTPETAVRYGVSVGAAGFEWHGTARLQFCRSWPIWKVPEVMYRRRPDLERYSVANGGMPGGLGNPLGARALYLFQNGVDTLYRVHGNAAPMEIGHAYSSGCIRMLDQDVIDLHKRAIHGADVIVLASIKPVGLQSVY